MSDADVRKEHISAGVWSWDVTRDIVYADPLVSRLFNLLPSEGATGQPLSRLLKAIHPDDLSKVRETVAQALKGEPFEMRYRVISRDLGERKVLASGRCYFDTDGKPTIYPGFVIDLSERESELLAQLAAHLSACMEIARKLELRAVSYLLKATKNEMDHLNNQSDSRLN